MTRRLRFIQWNINGFSTLRGQGDLLASLPWDVAALQEVTTGAWPQLRGLADDAEVAIGRLPPLAGDPPRYHAALLVRRPFALHDAAVLRDVPSPERTLVGTVTVEEVAITVASLAVPPGVSWGDAGKGRQAARYAAWLRDRTRPTVVGMDANSPKWDRWDLADTEFWNDREATLHGVQRAHDLRDVWRDYLDRHPDEAASLRRERPEGPLTVSFVRGRGSRRTSCRYDLVYASPEIEVEEVTYRYDDAVEAGSDHGLVLAELILPRR